MFRDLLNETKDLKYQVPVKFLLKKYKHNGEIEFAPVHLNSVTKTVINYRFRFENSFQEILYTIDVCINNGSGWNVQSIESQYINISTYRPLSGSSHMDLPVELKSQRKGLTNIKNKDKKCFYGVISDILILQKNILKKIKKLKKKKKKIAEKNDYNGTEFPVKKKEILTRLK